jgi:hypothetical protein
MNNEQKSNIDLNEILCWCDSIQDTWNPKEEISQNTHPMLIPEQFLSTAIRYLRAVCVEQNKQ